jgi:hypothetical protein
MGARCAGSVQQHVSTTTPRTHSPRRGHGPPRPECHTLNNCRHPTHITTSGSVAPSPTEDSAAGVWGRNQSGPHANPSPRDVTLTLGLRVTVRATGAEGSHRAALPLRSGCEGRAAHTRVAGATPLRPPPPRSPPLYATRMKDAPVPRDVDAVFTETQAERSTETRPR